MFKISLKGASKLGLKLRLNTSNFTKARLSMVTFLKKLRIFRKAFLCNPFQQLLVNIMSQRLRDRYLKNGVSKSIFDVINNENFQLYRAYLVQVIWICGYLSNICKHTNQAFYTSNDMDLQNNLLRGKNIVYVMFIKFLLNYDFLYECAEVQTFASAYGIAI